MLGSQGSVAGRLAVQKLCQEQMITGFPSIRIYRKGSDDVVVHGFHEHEAYRGDRTEAALKAFVDKVVPSAGQPAARSSDTRRKTLGQGCMVRTPAPQPLGRRG